MGVPTRSACERAGLIWVPACSGWHVWQAYTLCAAMSQVLMREPQRPQCDWLYTYLRMEHYVCPAGKRGMRI